MRPSEQIQRLTAALHLAKAQGALWRAQLISLGVTPVDVLPAWATGLAPNEAVLMQILLDKWPRVVSVWAPEEGLPKKDHARERDIKIIDQYVYRLRHRPAIGSAAIENVFGRGYRCSDDFHAKYGSHASQLKGDDMTDQAAGQPADSLREARL